MSIKKKRQFWTDEEKNTIKKNYTTHSKEELLKMFPDRTWKAIRSMGVKLGLKRSNDYEVIPNDDLFRFIDEVKYMKCKSCRRYLPADDIYFPRDLSLSLGIRGVCKECKGENFRKRDFWNQEETQIIRDYYKTKTNQWIKDNHLPHKSLVQIAHKASSMGIAKNKEVSYLALRNSHTEEWRNKISETKKRNGSARGENNPMFGSSRTGSENPNWQGGVSELYAHLRRNLTEWKADSAKNCNYRCVLTNDRFEDIHHLYSFHTIVEEAMSEVGLPIYEEVGLYTDSELQKITEKCKEVHNRYPLGICLKGNIHKLFHSLYGYSNNTPEQFEEFKNRYQSGEFEDMS